jgi:hypothetical protein
MELMKRGAKLQEKYSTVYAWDESFKPCSGGLVNYEVQSHFLTLLSHGAQLPGS